MSIHTLLSLTFILQITLNSPPYNIAERVKGKYKLNVDITRKIMMYFTQILENAYNYTQNSVCKTSSCIKSAFMILRNIDTTVNPCQNFYEFACGNYIKSRTIPDDKSTVNIPHSIGDLLEEKVRDVLDEQSTENDLRSVSLARKLFKTCMNTCNTY